MTKWSIRPFMMADYEAVIALWREAGPGLVIRPSDTRDEVEKKLSRDPDLFLVAEVAGRVIGVVMGAWDGRRGWLHHLAVAQGHRGQGAATALVREVESRLRLKGCLKVNLLVRAGNIPARHLYASLGYEEMPDLIAMGRELS